MYEKYILIAQDKPSLCFSFDNGSTKDFSCYNFKVWNKRIPDIVPTGESIVLGIAKGTGKYYDILRYPGENSKYEEDKMNKLRL